MSRRIGARLAAAMLAAGAATACAPSGQPPAADLPPTAAAAAAPAPSPIEREMHDLVNRQRARAGKPALQLDAGISAIAREHSRAMAQRRRPFGHDGFDERAAAIGQLLPASALAENIAYDSRPRAQLAASVVDGWIASPGHRDNMESDFDLTGIGAVTSPDGITFVTQIFVKR